MIAINCYNKNTHNSTKAGEKMSINYKLIGERIQKSRKEKNITQEELAELIEVSAGYISQIERGITKPNLTMMDIICTHIGCDLIYIITGIHI